MKVLDTYVFTYEQYKDIKVLTDIVQQVKEDAEDWDAEDREAWLTTNDWPNFHMITLYQVSERGLMEFYIHRPYHDATRFSGSGTIYKDVLLKATEKQKNMMLNDENFDKIFG